MTASATSGLLLVVPARFGSTRLPGKPLREIGGVPMIARTHANAARAGVELAMGWPRVDVVVATDDARIMAACNTLGINAVMTPDTVETGSDRALAAARALDPVGALYSHILNLQGDAPFTPPAHLKAVADALKTPGADAATAYVPLSWDALDALREHKRLAPFSGTTVILDTDGFAVWFSKTIIPAIRKEAALRQSGVACPVLRHVGLYGYRRDVLAEFAASPPSRYEQLEGLEQLRLLESGRRMACVAVEPPRISLGGIDTEADIALAERLLAQHGDPHEALR